MLERFLADLNISKQCQKYHVSIFACPQFLFIVIGVVIIIAMLGTTVLARSFSDDPAIVVIAVSVMAAFLFVIGQAIVASFERLADASRMKSEFVSIVSHQLRSPLSAIKWQLETMLENVKNVSGEAHDTMTVLKEQNERMIGLVNDLLEVNRIEDDRLILRPSLVSLDVFIGKIVKEYEPRASKSGIELTCEAEERPLWVFADEIKLRWITENLIDNALRYTLEKGRVHILLAREGGSGRVEVSDTGVGIPARDQASIFTKFFRAENALRLRTQGTGLGLYLVKALTKAMGGKVGFASLENKGSTFWFSLPLVRGSVGAKDSM